MDYASTIHNKTWRTIYKAIVSVQRFVGLTVCIAVPLLVTYQVFLR